MRKKIAPIAIFCYRRLDLLKKLLKSIEKNKNSKKFQVFFFLDNFKNETDKKDVIKVHNFIKNYNFFYKKKIILRNTNLGLKKNIKDGINLVFKKHDKIIVLEDDLEVSRNFFFTINTLLDKYKKNNEITSVTGYSFGNKNLNIKKNFFLLKRPSSWGWGTWKNKWISLHKTKLNSEPNLNDYGNDLIIMSLKKRKKILNSWAYDWTLKHIKGGKYCIYPKFSMVKNNGHDKYASNNVFKTDKFFNQLSYRKIKNYSYDFENAHIKETLKNFYNSNFILFYIKIIYFKLFYG